ncbi:hypothetical protein [Gluconobacter kanchanaburiensis]|uniref:Uncharacterized protein n=1 Tax=Gluconobacter kanchanaburiensis NBRC 103587 TaxID=1307948 RepID=A0A511B6V1_9PROT|nr:hypothetical protein [Gluconobacter kanchanaburiensis]MBF0860559.1 hypothetical protein [Gluconobacter kanchanaburiensis]GBR69357.1 hypothetical protein AA103587_1280 [Gluconobacter kanchanaburiensis NBRC 103587]GEK96190.1 hypothetical protein GKA01_13870 [Gluconobacter kanchanaburiensis NBRC 103587]
MPDLLERRLIGELTTPVEPGVVGFADALARACPVLPLGVLFYGSMLRTADPEGILDFYIVTEDASGFSGGLVARTGNLVLPPNVRYAEFRHGTRTLRAKIAVLSRAQFAARTGLAALDTTVWARFCQPVRLVWVRDSDSADAILSLIANCVTTASCWAALLGRASMTALEFWQILFAHTYGSELRVEKKGRGNTILEGQEARYESLLPLGWARGGLVFSANGEKLTPAINAALYRKSVRRWALVEASGRPRNVARLVKAAFTFENGASYLAWKIQRHTGFDMRLSPFESRHPLMNLPVLLWRARHLLSRRKAP